MVRLSIGRIFLLLLYTMGSMLHSAAVRSDGFIKEKETVIRAPLKTSGETDLDTWFACYRVWDGAVQDCAVTHKATEVINETEGDDAGHGHSLSTRPAGELDVRGTKTPAKDGVEAQTQNERLLIKHKMPEPSGKILMESTVTTEEGYHCGGNCFTWNSWKDRQTVDVKVDGLTLLPDPTVNDYYIKVRGGKDTHPEGYFALPSTIQAIQQVAELYYQLSLSDLGVGRKLSINDMSLPKGGMFDLNTLWWVTNTIGNGHTTHRTGTDADINRDDIDCWDDLYLRAAADWYLPPSPRKIGGNTALLCEGASKHIDF